MIFFSPKLELSWVEWGFYALSASKAIFRARTYNCNLFMQSGDNDYLMNETRRNENVHWFSMYFFGVFVYFILYVVLVSWPLPNSQGVLRPIAPLGKRCCGSILPQIQFLNSLPMFSFFWSPHISRQNIEMFSHQFFPSPIPNPLWRHVTCFRRSHLEDHAGRRHRFTISGCRGSARRSYLRRGRQPRHLGTMVGKERQPNLM